MTFEEKLAQYRVGSLSPDHEVAAEKLAAIGITSPPKYLAKVLFEPAVFLGSPAIAEARAIFIGTHSYMNDGGYLRDNVMIGRYCSIGRRVTIGAGKHAMRGVSTSPFLNRVGGSTYSAEQRKALGFTETKSTGPAIIRHDVWIGDGAVVMPGITISTRAIIGANAVVTRDVPPYVIVGGVPAKPIGQRFPKGVSERLLSSDYWELPDGELKLMPLNNVFEFLERLETKKPVKLAIPTYALGVTS